MTRKTFFKKFKEYMIDTDHTKNSADSYVSYLNKLCDDLGFDRKLLDDIAASKNNEERSRLCELFNIALTKAREDANCSIPKKALANYKSAILRLMAFVSYTGKSEAIINTQLPYSPIGAKSCYDRADLISIFKSRLKTQDRMSYGFGCYPARIINQILTNGQNKVDLYKNLINETKFICSSDQSLLYRLKEIDKLTIENGHAYVTVNGKTFVVYTETFKNGASTGFVKATVNTISDLSLDHDQPLYEVLKANLPSYLEYKKLSDSVLEYRKERKKDGLSIFSRSYYNNVYSTLQINESQLIKEIVDFIGKLSLTIMDQKANSSKGKTISQEHSISIKN